MFNLTQYMRVSHGYSTIDGIECGDRDAMRKGLSSLIILPAWWIWKHRNSCTFDGDRPSVSHLCSTIKDEARLWAMAGAAGDRAEGVGGGGDWPPFAGDAFAEYSSSVFAELGGWSDGLGAGAGELPPLDLPAASASGPVPMARSDEIMPAASGEPAGAASSCSSGDGAISLRGSMGGRCRARPKQIYR